MSDEDITNSLCLPRNPTAGPRQLSGAEVCQMECLYGL